MANRKLIDKALNFLAKPSRETVTFTKLSETSPTFWNLRDGYLYKRGFIGELVLFFNDVDPSSTPTRNVRASYQMNKTQLNLFGDFASGVGVRQDHIFVMTLNTDGMLNLNGIVGSWQLGGTLYYAVIPLLFNK